MDKKQFWGLIEAVNNKVYVNDQEAVLKATREALCGLSFDEIVEWYKIYRELHKKAYRDDLWDAVAACGIHATDDGFIDFRAWLISRGQVVYEAVMAVPETLSAYVPTPREANFELYGYITADAFAEKACRDALGDAGFEAFKKEWLLENRDAIEENADWNGQSPEVSGERLFYSELVGKYDIYKNPQKPLDATLSEAKAKAGENPEAAKDEDKGLC